MTTLQTDRYQVGGFPHNKGKAPRRWSARGRDMTEVAAMQEKNLHVRVSYSTDCPEWWRIMVGRRLGKQHPATRAECVEWLRRYGQSEDDNLALAWQRMNDAIADGEEVDWDG